MRHHHRTGEKLFVDDTGPTLALADGERGQALVDAMGTSSFTFSAVRADQWMRSWLGPTGRALRCLGGMPQMVMPANARALTAYPVRYESPATTRRWTSPGITKGGLKATCRVVAVACNVAVKILPVGRFTKRLGTGLPASWGVYNLHHYEAAQVACCAVG